MKFIKYEKIHRLGKEETNGILIGNCFIQEKIDGANTQIWMEDGEIRCGSRNNILESGFNGFVDYVNEHEGIKRLLTENPEWRLYGEWLVRHTVQYNETAYKQFYLFDILVGDKFLTTDEVYAHAIEYDIKTPKLFGYIENPTIEQLQEFVGKSDLGEYGEGIVIKNFDFVNQFYRCDYAKLVTEKFKETNSLVFGGNNKHSESYWEMYIVNQFITLERIKKIMHKIQPLIEKKLDFEHTPRIAGTVLNDMITEEAWTIFNKVPSVNNKLLKNLASRKIIQIYHDILNNNISVADQKNE